MPSMAARMSASRCLSCRRKGDHLGENFVTQFRLQAGGGDGVDAALEDRLEHLADPSEADRADSVREVDQQIDVAFARDVAAGDAAEDAEVRRSESPASSDQIQPPLPQSDGGCGGR